MGGGGGGGQGGWLLRLARGREEGGVGRQQVPGQAGWGLSPRAGRVSSA